MKGCKLKYIYVNNHFNPHLSIFEFFREKISVSSDTVLLHHKCCPVAMKQNITTCSEYHLALKRSIFSQLR